MLLHRRSLISVYLAFGALASFSTWLDRAPYVRMLKEPKRRIRWISPEQAEALCSALPEHLEAMCRFSLATGLRESNVTGLEWSQVDLEPRVAWIHADQSKSGRAMGIPLNNEAVVVLRKQSGKHKRYVFTYFGKRIAKAKYRELPLARFAPYLGQLACSKRHADTCVV